MRFLVILSYLAVTSLAEISYETTYDQVVLESAPYVPGYYNMSQFRVSKYNRSVYVLNVKIEYFIDLDETVFVEIEVFRSQLNNNQYEKSPFRVPKMDYCSYLKGPYQRIMMDGLKNCSNFPQADDIEKNCLLKKVNFFEINFHRSKSV